MRGVAADAHHGGRILGRPQEVRSHLLTALHEQIDRGVRPQGVRVRNRGGVGHGQREDRDNVLAAEAQPGAAGHQGFEPGTGAQEIGKIRSSGDDLLEVIKDEQQLAIVKRLLERGQGRATTRFTQPHGQRDRGQDQIGIGDGRQPNQANAVAKRLSHRRPGRESEAGLADAAGSGERDQAHAVPQQGFPDGVDITLPADE